VRLTGPEPFGEVGRNLRDIPRLAGASTIGAGLVATLLGITGPALLVYQAAANAGYPEEVTDSWFFAIFVGGGLLSLLLALLYRQPVCGAYPIAGSALLASVLAGYGLSEAVGAFLVSGILVALIGFSGLFGVLMARMPSEVIMGALAGILFRFGTEVFTALPGAPVLVGAMLTAYLASFRLVRRLPPALAALAAGLVVVAVSGRFEAGDLRVEFAQPVFVAPSFDLTALFSIAVPLTLLAVATQNAPGVSILRTNGYEPPANAITIFSGVGSVLTAPLVGNGINIAAPMTAVCAAPDSHPDPESRYIATVVQGFCFVAFGVLGATAISLIQSLPAALVAVVAGLALLPVILQSLQLSVGGTRHTLAAGVALLVAASGLSLLGIGSAFWAIVTGVLLAPLLGQYGKEGA